MTEGGPINEIDADTDDDEKYREKLPGVQKGDLSKRRTKPMILTKGVMFSPTNRSWAATTTEGLLIYSLDETLIFDPFELDIEVTPQSTLETLQKGQFLKALVMSFRLNEKPIIEKVFESIPPSEILLVVEGFPFTYVQKLLSFIANHIEKSPHLEYHLLWLAHLFNIQGKHLKDRSNNFMSLFRNLQKNISRQHQDIAKVSDENMYSLDYITAIAKVTKKPESMEVENPFSSGVKRKVLME